MKLLFKVADYANMKTMTVEDAIREIYVMRGSNFGGHNLYDFLGDKNYVIEHMDDVLMDISGNEVIDKLMGTVLSTIACYAYEEPYDDGRFGFANAFAKSYSTETNWFLLGAKEGKKLEEFARQMQKTAQNNALAILKKTGLWGKTINEQVVQCSIPEMEKACQAFSIMTNKPDTKMDEAVLDEFDKRVKCWPDERQLLEILEHPEMYAVADVEFHGLW